MTTGMWNLEYIFKSVCDTKKKIVLYLNLYLYTSNASPKKLDIYKTNLNFIDFKRYITDAILISVVW